MFLKLDLFWKKCKNAMKTNSVRMDGMRVCGHCQEIVSHRKLNVGFYSKIYHCQNLSVQYLPH